MQIVRNHKAANYEASSRADLFSLMKNASLANDGLMENQ